MFSILKLILYVVGKKPEIKMAVPQIEIYIRIKMFCSVWVFFLVLWLIKKEEPKDTFATLVIIKYACSYPAMNITSNILFLNGFMHVKIVLFMKKALSLIAWI